MKAKVLTLIFTALVVLAVVPVKNIVSGVVKMDKKLYAKPEAELFNFDFALSFPSFVFYKWGMSLDPDQCLAGKSGWLYLGDMYQSVITNRRRLITDEDEKTARRIGEATQAWDAWLKNKGVKVFRVMLAPDKETIYPEFLPDWARPVTPSLTDNLMPHVAPVYIDTRLVLKEARAGFDAPLLYYQTDTHWNSLGAWLAFRHFIKEIGRTESGVWLGDEDVRLVRTFRRKGGDLARFLYLGDTLTDLEADMEIKIKDHPPIETEESDFDSTKVFSTGGNPKTDAFFGYTVRIKSPNALNHKKVLWLCDSFATAVAPYMAATFSDLVMVHYDQAGPERFAELVETYKPDYVFMTVVERYSREKVFESFPPLAASR